MVPMSFAFNDLDNLDDEDNSKKTVVVGSGFFDEPMDKLLSEDEAPEEQAPEEETPVIEPIRSQLSAAALAEKFEAEKDAPLSNFGDMSSSSDLPPKRSNRKRMLIRVSGVILGVVLSIFFFLDSEPSYQELEDAERALIEQSEEFTIEESASVESAGELAEPEAEPAPKRVSLSDNTPEHIENFIETRELKTAPRKFIYSGGEKRIYETEFQAPELKQGKEAKFDLKKAPEGDRLNPTTGGMQWQGGWKVNNPKKNLEIAEDYDKYLKDYSGGRSNRFKSLRSIEENRPIYPRPERVVPKK